MVVLPETIRVIMTCRAAPAAASAATPSSRPWCWRRWPASPTAPSAGCAASTAGGLEPGGVSGRPGCTSARWSPRAPWSSATPESMRLIRTSPTRTRAPSSSTASTRRPSAPPCGMLVTEDRADHIDLNFGCPVPKVTRKGGGAALPWKTRPVPGHRRAPRSTRRARTTCPVTVKMRKGIDDDHLTYLEAGLIAEGEGVAAVALHARTAVAGLLRHGRLGGDRAAQGDGDRHPGARQRRHLVGRGRPARWSAQTGCDGVVVGRGCLGRPWLFADLAAAFAGSAAAGAARPRRGRRRRCGGTPS